MGSRVGTLRHEVTSSWTSERKAPRFLPNTPAERRLARVVARGTSPKAGKDPFRQKFFGAPPVEVE